MIAPVAANLGGSWFRNAHAASAGSRSSATMPAPAAPRGAAVQPGAGAGGLPGRHALRQQPGDHAGQHVAGAGGGQPGRRRGVDRGAAVRRGDDRVGALQQHHRAGARARRRRRGGEAVGAGAPNTRANSPACGVSTAAPRNASGSPAKAVSASASATTRRPAASRPARAARAASGAEARAAHPDLAARVLQQLVQRRLVDQQAGRAGAIDVAARRGGDGHHAGAGAARRVGGQPRRAGHRRAAEHGDVAARIFVGVGRQARAAARAPAGWRRCAAAPGPAPRRAGRYRPARSRRTARGRAAAGGPASGGRR